MTEPPISAVNLGREHIRRLIDHYQFACDAGPLGDCCDFLALTACFDAMAEWIEEEGGDWEPSEAQQGLIPIPKGYNEL